MIARVLGFLNTAIKARMKPIAQRITPKTFTSGIHDKIKPIKATTKPATPRPFLLVFSAIIEALFRVGRNF